MFEFLHKKVKETISITDEEFEYAKTLFVPEKTSEETFSVGGGRALYLHRLCRKRFA